MSILFTKMPGRWRKRVDTADEATLKAFGLSLKASSTPSSAHTSPSLWLPCCHSSSLLLCLPKLLQLPRRRSNPFSDVRHSRLVDRNAIVLTLLHLHSLFQIRGEAVCGAVELFEGWVSVVSGALRFVKAAGVVRK